MRVVVQRVAEAQVSVDGAVVGRIGRGFLVLVGAERGDGAKDVEYLAEKVVGLRIFEDADKKMNLDLAAVGGGLLAVSQFTLLGDCRKGRRPSFAHAEAPEIATRLFDAFVDAVRRRGVPVETGVFGARMAVALVNDGPVTLLLDSRR